MITRRQIGLWIALLLRFLVVVCLPPKFQVSGREVTDKSSSPTLLSVHLRPNLLSLGVNAGRDNSLKLLYFASDRELLQAQTIAEDPTSPNVNHLEGHRHSPAVMRNSTYVGQAPPRTRISDTLNRTRTIHDEEEAEGQEETDEKEEEERGGGGGGGMTNSSSNSSETPETDPVLRNFYKEYPVEKWKALGLFDEGYLEHINRFWLTFEPASPSSHHTLAVLYIIIMTVGCSGNLLVILMFICCRSLRTPANYLILNLAVSDFGMLVKMPVFIINSFYEGPALGTLGCQIYGFLGGLTGTCSIMTLTAIAVDRYYVIVHPLSPNKKTTHARAILMIIAVWFYSAFFSSMPLIGINEYVAEGYLTSCSFDYLRTDVKSRVFIFIFFLAAWALPLTLITFSYIAIFRMVLQAEKMDFFNGANTRESFKYNRIKDKLRKDVKIAIITTFLVMLWVLAWTPYAVVALLGIFGQEHLLTPFVSTLPALFCKTSSCINPFIYSISHPRFQKELRLKINNLCRFRKASGVTRRNSTPSQSCDISISDVNSDLRGIDSEINGALEIELDDRVNNVRDSFHMSVRREISPATDNTSLSAARQEIMTTDDPDCDDDGNCKGSQDKVCYGEHSAVVLESISDNQCSSISGVFIQRAKSETSLRPPSSATSCRPDQKGTCKRTRSLSPPKRTC